MSVEVETKPREILDYYKPFAKQRTFHTSPAKYRLFGGAAGPGKTKALLWEAIYQALEVSGADTLLLRRTYPELEASLLAQFRRDVPRDLYRTFNESKRIVTWHNGSTTRFGYCLRERDVYQYQGAEYLFIGIDELTLFTLRQWQWLTSRNRCSIPGSFATMAGASNPGNIGHAWVKALWVDHTTPAGFERPELYDASEYDFIRAKLEDNPIYANDANYRATLEVLPTHLRKAFLEGDWSVFAGQYFDIFDVGRHIIDRVESIGIQTWWPKWVSIDWGFNHPSAVYWHTRREDGKVFTYREFVKSGLSPRMLAQAIVERSRQRVIDPEGRETDALEPIKILYLSPDAFAHRTAESSIAEQLGDVLRQNGLPLPTPADDDRVGGWQLWYGLLQCAENTNGAINRPEPMWAVTAQCPRLIESIPTLVRDDLHIEDIAKMDGDDPADSCRYGIYSMLREKNLPWSEQLKAQTKEIEDPTARAIYTQRLIARRAELEKQDGMGPYRSGGRTRWQQGRG